MATASKNKIDLETKKLEVESKLEYIKQIYF